MFRWNIFLDEGPDNMSFLGTVHADTMSEALHLASQYFEYKMSDLIAIQVNV